MGGNASAGGEPSPAIKHHSANTWLLAVLHTNTHVSRLSVVAYRRGHSLTIYDYVGGQARS